MYLRQQYHRLPSTSLPPWDRTEVNGAEPSDQFEPIRGFRTEEEMLKEADDIVDASTLPPG